jgi:hypothetical protein
MEWINLKPLSELKLRIEKLKADHESELRKLEEEYETQIDMLKDQHKVRLDKSGELYDVKNDLTLVPIYADREVDKEKLYKDLPDKYWEIAHISAKNICEYLRYDMLEEQIYNIDTTEDKREYRKLVKIKVEDAKKTLTKREMEDYWMPRKIQKYDLDLKIK